MRRKYKGWYAEVTDDGTDGFSFFIIDPEGLRWGRVTYGDDLVPHRVANRSPRKLRRWIRNRIRCAYRIKEEDQNKGTEFTMGYDD